MGVLGWIPIPLFPVALTRLFAMTLNDFLIQLVLFTSLFLVLQAKRVPRGWLGVSGVLLVAVVVGWAIAPQWAGYFSGGLWFLLFLLPLLGSALVNRLVLQDRYVAARRLAAGLKWLHPADGFVDYPQLLQGMALAQRGEQTAARLIFDRYRTRNTPMGRMATVMGYRMDAQWHALAQWIETAVPPTTIAQEPGLMAIYLRSLGEVGDLNRLLSGIDQWEQHSRQMGTSLALHQARLYGLAFCGQVEAVQHLLAGQLSVYSRSTQQFWLATAEQMAGQDAIAHRMLAELRQVPDHLLWNAIDWRQSRPAIDPAQVLTEGAYQVLRRIKTAIDQEQRYPGWRSLSPRRSIITCGLIGLNVAIFGWSVWQGSLEDSMVLYDLGALAPDAVVAGEWWRVLTATFLHAGALHLIANMGGLYIFGTWVESVLGHLRFSLCYVFCGMGSMLAVVAIAVLQQNLTDLTIGASGAILGLVGAEAAIQWQGWRWERAKVARERLQFIGIVIGFQVLSDLITPQVSVIGHFSGLILGIVAGLVLYRRSHK